MIEVEMSFAEILSGGNAGVMRWTASLKQGMKHRDPGYVDPLEAYVSGTVAEYAVAKWLGVYIDPCKADLRRASDVPGDVLDFEVRSTDRPNGALIVHDYSFDERRYVLVLTDRAPTYRIVGWPWGHEAKDKRYWREDVPRPAFFVPQSALRDMVTFEGPQLQVAA